MDNSPFFISGTQRSGTTLLCRILHVHSRIWTRNELRWRVFELLVEQPSETAELRELLASLLSIDAAFSSDSRFQTGSPAMDCFATAMSLAATKPRWCFKDPHLTYHLDHFQTKLKDSKFIILLRDPRATVSSYLNQRWYVANAHSGAVLWKKEVAIQLDFARRFPEQCLVVRYENLVRELPKTLKTVCDFLDEQYEPSLERFFEQETPFDINKSNQNTFRPIQPAFIDKWEQQLTAAQIDAIEDVAGAQLHALGYERYGSGRSFGRSYRLFCKLHQIALTNYWWQKRARLQPMLQKLGLKSD